MSMIDLIICINIYKLSDLFKRQMQSITDHVRCSHAIFLSCNEAIALELRNQDLPDTIFVNPEIINKQRDHGSLFHGIVSNLQYAYSLFHFKYCIILSGRTIFYKPLTLPDLDMVPKICNKVKAPFPTRSWHWSSFKKSLLAKYYMSQGYILVGSEHEGLCFSYNVTTNILNFLNTHPNIMHELFIFPKGVEEFALQTIATIEIDPSNLEYGFSLLGHGVGEMYDIRTTHKYTCKI